MPSVKLGNVCMMMTRLITRRCSFADQHGQEGTCSLIALVAMKASIKALVVMRAASCHLEREEADVMFHAYMITSINGQTTTNSSFNPFIGQIIIFGNRAGQYIDISIS